MASGDVKYFGGIEGFVDVFIHNLLHLFQYYAQILDVKITVSSVFLTHE